MPKGHYDRSKMRRAPSQPLIEKAPRPPAIMAAVVLPDNGELLLKIIAGPSKVLFTLAIDGGGVQYFGNHKKTGTARIRWDVLESLSKAGLLK